MPRLPDLASGFKVLREVDLNAIRRQAEEPFHVAVVGDTGSGKSTLISQLLAGPGKAEPFSLRPVSEHGLNDSILIQPHTMVIMMLDSGKSEHATERQVLEKLRQSGSPVIICYNKMDLIGDMQLVSNEALRWPAAEIVAISATDRRSLQTKLVPALLRIYKGKEIQLARHLPMLREQVSQNLIEDTSFINAAYSLATGLGSANVLLTIPLNVADMVVLSKNQAVMAYKISLAFNLPSDWRETIPKLAAVVGTGFLWRTIARQLVGLVPVIGIVPNVAVSYAGTYAIGQAIYQWCANGIRVNPQFFKSAYYQALNRGRSVARRLVLKRRAVSQDYLTEPAEATAEASSPDSQS